MIRKKNPPHANNSIRLAQVTDGAIEIDRQRKSPKWPSFAGEGRSGTADLAFAASAGAAARARTGFCTPTGGNISCKAGAPRGLELHAARNAWYGAVSGQPGKLSV